MKADYKNWVPKGMLTGFAVGSGALALGAAGLGVFGKSKGTRALAALTGVGAAGCGAFAAWCVFARGQFSYDGKRKLSKQIVEGTAEYVTLPDGGVGLDVGCGSGALTIACAKRNPGAHMVGCDAWGPEYASFSRELCEQNAAAEGAENTEYRVGNAKKLPFADETFDAVTSNYVYHNVMGADRQKLLLETLRVLKKGGTFAIHDIMSPARYGDMQAFCDKLRTMGYGDCRDTHCLHELMRRLRQFGEFPHEIGLILSYPPEDVRGFIEHKGHGSKCDGCWKVYGDAERARKTFCAYKKCTDCYCRRKAAGASLERLAVVG